MSTATSLPVLKILAVDDDAALLELLTRQLQEAGYEVTTAGSAEQALAQVSIARPDLVITDLTMGGLDGMALFEALHHTQPTLPVIVLTGHGTIADAVAATRRGVVGYLTKPFDAETLLGNVERALSAGVAASVKRDTGRMSGEQRSSRAAQQWSRSSPRRFRSQQVMQVCLFTANPGPGRNSWRGRYTTRVRDANRHS